MPFPMALKGILALHPNGFALQPHFRSFSWAHILALARANKCKPPTTHHEHPSLASSPAVVPNGQCPSGPEAPTGQWSCHFLQSRVSPTFSSLPLIPILNFPVKSYGHSFAQFLNSTVPLFLHHTSGQNSNPVKSNFTCSESNPGRSMAHRRVFL